MFDLVQDIILHGVAYQPSIGLNRYLSWVGHDANWSCQLPARALRAATGDDQLFSHAPSRSRRAIHGQQAQGRSYLMDTHPVPFLNCHPCDIVPLVPDFVRKFGPFSSLSCAGKVWQRSHRCQFSKQQCAWAISNDRVQRTDELLSHDASSLLMM